MNLLKKGADGKVFEWPRSRVFKQFRKNKNVHKIVLEHELQRRAANAGLAPRVYNLFKDGDDHWGFVMEKMSHTLMDEIRKDNGLSGRWQREMIRVLKGLDAIRVFHGDISPINLMIKHNRLYAIDFGKSREMNDAFIASYGKHANLKIGSVAFIMKLREFVPTFDPKLLQKYAKM